MRLIDADELRNWIMQNPFASTHEMLDAVYDAPTISAVPVVHGRWEKRKEDTLIHWDCTQCGIGFLDDIGLDKLHYCPNCGAKMDLED